jgi:hypothetical protein
LTLYADPPHLRAALLADAFFLKVFLRDFFFDIFHLTIKGLATEAP